MCFGVVLVGFWKQHSDCHSDVFWPSTPELVPESEAEDVGIKARVKTKRPIHSDTPSLQKAAAAAATAATAAQSQADVSLCPPGQAPLWLGPWWTQAWR